MFLETAFEEAGMLMRVLTMRVRDEHLEDWKRYTKEVGFPGMLSLVAGKSGACAG